MVERHLLAWKRRALRSARPLHQASFSEGVLWAYQKRWKEEQWWTERVGAVAVAVAAVEIVASAVGAAVVACTVDVVRIAAEIEAVAVDFERRLQPW